MGQILKITKIKKRKKKKIIQFLLLTTIYVYMYVYIIAQVCIIMINNIYIIVDKASIYLMNVLNWKSDEPNA